MNNITINSQVLLQPKLLTDQGSLYDVKQPADTRDRSSSVAQRSSFISDSYIPG